MLLSMSGFTFAAHSEKTVTMAYNYGISSSIASSLERIPVALDSLQLLYNSGVLTLGLSAAKNSGSLTATLHPNPSGAAMPFLSTEGRVYMKPIGLQGQTLHEQYTESGTLPFMNLPAGMYLLHLTGPKGSRVIKWMKE